MTRYRLRLIEDRVEPGRAWDLPAVPRALYLREGEAAIAGLGRTVGVNSVGFTDIACQVRALAPAIIWRFELVPLAAEIAELGRSRTKLSAEIKLDPGRGHLFRCDRVDFPVGCVTPKHTHMGPGIRCVLHGEIRSDIGGVKGVHLAGDAWFERGPDPVVGAAEGETAFVRAMILPQELLGESSFRATDEREAQKPRPMRYTLFVDQPIALP